MSWREDKTLIVLWASSIFFSFVVVGVVLMRPSDGQLYTLFATVFSNFTGALTLHLTGRSGAPPAGSTTVTKVDQITSTPPDKQ